jgi:hypothetical protein
MKTAKNKPLSELATNKQLEAVKHQAIALWGDDWLSRLCDAYETKNNLTRTSKNSNGNSKIRSWFRGDYKPSLTSFNQLLIAVECEMSITAKPRQIL